MSTLRHKITNKNLLESVLVSLYVCKVQTDGFEARMFRSGPHRWEQQLCGSATADPRPPKHNTINTTLVQDPKPRQSMTDTVVDSVVSFSDLGSRLIYISNIKSYSKHGSSE